MTDGTIFVTGWIFILFGVILMASYHYVFLPGWKRAHQSLRAETRVAPNQFQGSRLQRQSRKMSRKRWQLWCELSVIASVAFFIPGALMVVISLTFMPLD